MGKQPKKAQLKALARRKKEQKCECIGLYPWPKSSDRRKTLRSPFERMIKGLLLMLLRFYRAAISPWIGNVCRFEPSCSRYSMACIETHGAARGSWLTVKRLCKCHPFHPGGYDPPPPALSSLSAPLTEFMDPVSRPSVDADSSSTGSL